METPMHCHPFRRRGPTWAFPCESANPLDLVPDLACADWRRVRAVTGRSPAGTCPAPEGVCR